MRGALEDFLRLARTRPRHGYLFADSVSLKISFIVLWLGAIGGLASWTADAGTVQTCMLVLGITVLSFGVACIAERGTSSSATATALRLLWLAMGLSSTWLLVHALEGRRLVAALAATTILNAICAHLVVQRGTLVQFMALSAANLAFGVVLYRTSANPVAAGLVTLMLFGLIPAVTGTMEARRTLLRAVHEHAGYMESRLGQVAAQVESQTLAERLAVEGSMHQLTDLLRRTSQSHTVPLPQTMAEEAASLAGVLRTSLLLRSSSTWVGRILASQPEAEHIRVFDADQAADRIALRDRPAIVAVTLLLSGGAPWGVARRMECWVERISTPARGNEVLLMWRVPGLRKSQLSPLVWSELSKVGKFRIVPDPSGVTVHLSCKDKDSWGTNG